MTLSAARRISCKYLDEQADDKARIFNIQRYSLNDGQGIRTVVFFKGCPHRCPWCANPESMSGSIEIVRRKSKCLHCGPCLYDVDECPSGALELIGRDVTLDSLEKEVLKDDIFYRSSGGGVTLSGGEVLMQAGFATLFLARLRRMGINTAIETAGDAPATRLLSVARQCNDVLFDLKIMDEKKSKELLHINLPRVLDNFRLLVKDGIHVIPRIPLIPGYTMTWENMSRVLDVLRPFKINELHLLPFHQYGEPKYFLLGKTWQMKDVPQPNETDIAPLRLMAESAGYRVTVGG